MMNLTSIAPSLVKQGVWGPVTATLDWCEINHQFSPYVAEMANTFSNLFTISLALFGSTEAYREGLPTRYILGYLNVENHAGIAAMQGVALVGIGSFFFHATLLFEAQLADELPMIYVGSMSLWTLLDTAPGYGLHKARPKVLIGILALFDVLFTWSYIMYRNPVYHQVVFASLVIATTLRITYLLQMTEAGQRIPPKAKATISDFFTAGAGMFALGFFLWNLDNIFCQHLTKWKVAVGWPAGFFLEGHSWWHILTGLGSYYMYIGIQHATLCVKDDPQGYTVKYRYGVPHIRNLHNLKKQ